MKGLILASVMLAGMTIGLFGQVNHQGTSTNNSNSSALGINSNSSGMASFSTGVNCSSPGICSHSIGMSSRAEGMYSISLGTMAISEGNYGIAMGTYLKSSGVKSITIGSGYPNSILTNSKPNSLMVGFNSDLPSFYVSSSAGPGTIGKVGIGTTTPSGRLEVNAGGMDGLIIRNENTTNLSSNLKLITGNPAQAAITIMENGDTSLLINADGMLRTDNTMIAKEVKVRLNVWKDDVFRKPESLMQLDSLSKFIQEYGHLPGIPSEDEVIGKNTDLGMMCVSLLGKIEELTLYLLEINEQNTILQNEIAGLKSNKNTPIRP